MKVQYQVRAPQHGLGLVPSHANVVDRPVLPVAPRVEQDPTRQPEPLHALEERRQGARVPAGVLPVAELLEPVDLAPQPREPLDLLPVHPEVPASSREVRDAEGWADNLA